MSVASDSSLSQSLLSAAAPSEPDAAAITDAARSASPASPTSSCASLSQWYASHLPNPHSRVAFVVSFLLALSLSLWWLIITVRSKWLEDIAHPVQAVSWDRETKFTALFGLPLLYDDLTSNDQNTSYVRKVLPYWATPTAYSPLDEFVNCNETSLGYAAALCQPIDAQGAPLLNPANAPPGELDGQSAAYVDPSSWPLQFLDTSIQVLCLHTHNLYNQSRRDEQGKFDPPSAQLLSLSAQALLSANELLAAGHTSINDPAVTSFLVRRDGQQACASFTYNLFVDVQFSMQRSVDVKGAASLEFNYLVVGSQPMSQKTIEQGFQQLLASEPESDRERLIALRSDPSTVYGVSHICIQPRSYTVQTIRQVRTYGLSQFISDLGGFANILMLAFACLFPISWKAVQARNFLPLWLADKFSKKGKRKQSATGGVALTIQKSVLPLRVSSMSLDDSSDSTSSVPPFGLPDDVLLVAFHALNLQTRLTRIARVCRSWRALNDEPRSWISIGLPPSLRLRFESFHLTYLCRRFEFATSINLESCPKLCDGALELMWIHARSMAALDLSFCSQLTDACLSTLACSGAAQRLRSVRLHGLEHITDVGVVRFATVAPNLESIGLDGCEEVSSHALQALAQFCPRLQSVKLSGCVAVDDAGVVALAAGCPRLARLDLTKIHNVSDESLLALGSARLAEFSWISLSHCNQITDAGIAALAQGCPTLRSIGVAACTELRTPSLMQLATHCRGLTHLSLSWIIGFTDQGIDVLAKGCSALVSLHIAKCTDLSDASLLSLATHCRDLEVLDVSHLHLITDVGVQHLAAGLKRLRRFVCESCYRVNASSLAQLPIGCQVVTSMQRPAMMGRKMRVAGK